MELECIYRCRSAKYYALISFTKLKFSELLEIWRQYEIDIIKLHNFTSIQYSCKTNIHVVKWEKTFFNLNSGGIYGPQNGKSKYNSNDKTNSRFVVSMPENPLVSILMSCVEILTKS